MEHPILLLYTRVARLTGPQPQDKLLTYSKAKQNVAFYFFNFCMIQEKSSLHHNFSGNRLSIYAITIVITELLVVSSGLGDLPIFFSLKLVIGD